MKTLSARYVMVEYISPTTPVMKAEEDRLSYDDIFASVFQGTVIEDYPGDRPFPSCLIYGNTYSQEPVHSVWAYYQEVGRAILVTVYRPDPGLWIDWRVRRLK